MKERQFHVTWEIEVWAADPTDAARKAREIQLRPESIATVFVVQDSRNLMHEVDLSVPDGSR